MRLTLTVLATALSLIVFNHADAQRLPTGKEHTIRERTYDILHYKASLEFEFGKGKLFGVATITLVPLRRIDCISLDAITLNIHSVTTAKDNHAMTFRSTGRSLNIKLPSASAPGETIVVSIAYDATPRSGLYFRNDPKTQKYFVDTYGEGGLHANWLPIYNDVNDKFSSEVFVTVPPPYVVISNGKLVETLMKSEGFTTYHWLHTLPHSNYLMALYIGDYEQATLAPALGSIPMNVWAPRGRLEEAKYAFRNATKMVEHFSALFDYPYPWDKYDLIAAPDYTIGAMEHTGVSGHRDCVLRDSTAPIDFGPPTFDEYYSDWSSDATISHELAHHWFGDNITCANLSYIWLNESFASYAMMLWDEKSIGREQLMLDVQLAKQHYLKYVRDENTIRPLEYSRFDNSDAIYNEPHTYLKGACVLHTLRDILGDDKFFRTLNRFLKNHQYSNVVSRDFSAAVQEATGQNLDWFFDDWITGGGHPQFKVSYTYIHATRVIDLSVQQIQPIVEGQGVFTVPVTITIATPKRTWKERVWIRSDAEHFVLRCDEKPLMVSFDGEGNLVAEVGFYKEAEELAYQATHDSLAGRFWAMRRLAEEFPINKITHSVLEEIIAAPKFWADAAEAAQLLGIIRTEAALNAAQKALQSADYRIRKAAVLGLTGFGMQAEETLQQIILHDKHSDVVGTAIVALARVNRDVDLSFISQQLNRRSWFDEITIACLNAFGETRNAAAVSEIRRYVGPDYNQYVRDAAISAWSMVAPDDKELHRVLIDLAKSSTLRLQQKAVELLGDVYAQEAIPMLKEIQVHDFDANLTVGASDALEKIDRAVNNK